MSTLFLISLLRGEFILKSSKNSSYHPQVFYMPDKTKNINYDSYKSYLLCIEVAQNNIRPLLRDLSCS